MGLSHQMMMTMGDGSFSPRALSSLFAWYRGDNVTLDGSGNVQTWTDLGPNGFGATQSDAAHRPGYAANGGLGYVNNGAANGLVATSGTKAQPLEVFLVVRPAVSAANEMLFTSSGGVLIYRNVAGAVVGSPIAGVPLSDSVDHIVDVQLSGASSSVSVDGGTPNTGTTTGTLGATFYIGDYSAAPLTTFSFVGREYELIVCSAILSAGDRAATIAYLKSRYSIA